MNHQTNQRECGSLLAKLVLLLFTLFLIPTKTNVHAFLYSHVIWIQMGPLKSKSHIYLHNEHGGGYCVGSGENAQIVEIFLETKQVIEAAVKEKMKTPKPWL